MQKLFPAVIAALMLAACSSHRPPPPPSPYTSHYRTPRDENYHGGPTTLLKYDTNHDGSLTRAELQAGLQMEFATHGPDKKGCLSPDTVAAINAQRIADDQSAATPLQDWNQDGCVDLREYGAAANSLFDQLDTNGDGTVSAQEFNPAAGRRASGSAGPAGAGGHGRGRRGAPPDGGSGGGGQPAP